MGLSRSILKKAKTIHSEVQQYGVGCEKFFFFETVLCLVVLYYIIFIKIIYNYINYVGGNAERSWCEFELM